MGLDEVRFDGARIVEVRELAIHLHANGRSYWLPRSQLGFVRYADGSELVSRLKEGEVRAIEMAGWLVRKYDF